MGSPAYWGQLVNLTASLRKPALIPFGLFNAGDNLGFVADIPGADQSFSQASEVYAASLAIDVSAANVITIILTGNVTSTTLNYAGSSSIPDGQWVYVRFVQDSTGGRTVALPATLTYDQGFSVDPGPGRVTVLPIQWTGSAWEFFGQPFSSPGS